MQTRTAPEPTTSHRWNMQFTSHERSVSLVRKQVRRTLTAWGCADDDIATAVLICSELATNAVRHGHVPGHLFDVRLSLADTHCLIEVSDASRTAPTPTRMSDEAESGRGLHLIAALTNGRLEHHERQPIGKTVSAHLELKAGSQGYPKAPRPRGARPLPAVESGLGHGCKIA
jgi:anti-sigma regulatory factor (Ser/Thr protein kinase)